MTKACGFSPWKGLTQMFTQQESCTRLLDDFLEQTPEIQTPGISK